MSSKNLSHRKLQGESSIRMSSSESVHFVDTDMNELKLDLLQKHPEYNTKPASPCMIFNSGLCSNIHEEISDVHQMCSELLPRKISSPYSFADIKILNDELYAAGVTFNGVFVVLDLSDHRYFETVLTKHPLSSILVVEKEMIAIIKARDKPILYKVSMDSMKLVQKVTFPVTGIGKIVLDSVANDLFARAWDGKIWKIRVNDLNNFTEIFASSEMISMALSPQHFLFVGTSDKRILKLDLNGGLIETKLFKFRIDAFMFFSHNSEFLMLALPASIKLLDSKTLELAKDIETGMQAYSVHLSIDENYVIAGLESGELAFFSLSSKPSFKIKVHHSSITSIFQTSDMSKIYTFGSDSKLTITNFRLMSIFKTTSEINLPFNAIVMTSKEFDDNKPDDQHFKPLCMAISDKKDLIVVGGESRNIAVWDRQTMKKCGELMGHNDFVFSLACLNDSIAVSGGADCKVIVWNFRSLRKLSVLQGHLDVVSAVVKIDSSRFASGSWDRTVIIWFWEVQEKVFHIRNLPDKVVALCTPKFNKLLIGVPNFIYCWDLLTYCEMFKKKAESPISCFRVLETGYERSSVFIGLGLDENSLWFADPFMVKNVEVWGKDETGTYEFFYYIKSIFLRETFKHRPDLDRFTIFPYKLNALHFYAYFNLPEHLKQAISSGAALLNSSSGSNPLSLSIELGHKDCIEAIILSAWEQRKLNPYILSVVSISTLNELHLLKFPLLSKVYKLLMVSFMNSTYINQKKNQLPLVLTSANPTCFKVPKVSKSAEKLRNSRTLINFYMSPGSAKSIKFLYSLSLCSDFRIFSTELIQKFLMIKKRKLKVFITGEVVLFVCHFCFLVFYSCNPQRVVFKVLALLLGFLLFGLELATTVRITSFLGILCILQQALLVFWMIFRENVQMFDTLVVFLSAVYGVHYFQMFERSSQVLCAFSSIVSRVPVILLALFYFFLICFGFFETFSDLFNSLQPRLAESQNFLSVFVIFSFFLCISQHVSENKNSNQGRNLLGIILRIELLMFWNRNNQDKEFIQVFDKVNTNRVNGLKKVKQELRTLQKSMLESFETKRKKNEEVLKGIENLKKSMKEIQRGNSKQKRKTFQVKLNKSHIS